jgi:hypothetical protein
MEDVWNMNYDEVKRKYEKSGHLSSLCDRLQRWLTYQRHQAKTLTDEQTRKLDEIRYKDCPVVCESDELTWEEQFNRLRQAKEKKGNLRDLGKALSSWLTRQRRAFSENTLHPKRKDLLEGLGVSLVLDNSKRNKRGITAAKQANWMVKLEKYQEYRALNGHCNVPRRFKVDGLGDWVQRQRKSYVEMKTSSDPILKERFRLLNEIKFPWKHNEVKTHKHNQPGRDAVGHPHV